MRGQRSTEARILVYIYNQQDQWRIIFKWFSGNASEVEVIDYH
jgi:plasmid maintenance system killer protein